MKRYINNTSFLNELYSCLLQIAFIKLLCRNHVTFYGSLCTIFQQDTPVFKPLLPPSLMSPSLQPPLPSVPLGRGALLARLQQTRMQDQQQQPSVMSTSVTAAGKHLLKNILLSNIT